MTLKEARLYYGLSQLSAANIIGIPTRTLRRYETDSNYGSPYKRQQFLEILIDRCGVTEEKGILTMEQIQNALTALFQSEYMGKIDFCYLFGSYAKGYATEKSDVDLCVSTTLTGIKIAGLAEAIRNVLHKRVDLIRFDALEGNMPLIKEIMKDGVKLYG